ncbi:MAG: hypothetical protein LWX10_10890 [Spirochaetia bacterium]|nr:hypothetical protein [Spirochaetia bacterium]
MKKITFVLLAAIFVFGLGAESLIGFWGIPWGTSSSEIDTIMTQKGYQPAAKAANGWIYENVSFAGRGGNAFFVLKDSKLIGGSFRFIPKMKENKQSVLSDL